MKKLSHLLLLSALLLGTLFAPAPCHGEVFTLAVVPDTQQDVTGNPAHFNDRLQWLADHKDALNLKVVLHVGDLTNWDTPDHGHFVRASAGLEILDKAAISYAIAVGNHDTAAVKEGGSAAPGNVNANLRITATYNRYFPAERFLNLKGVFEPGKMDNAYHEFSAGGLNWLVINLELWPRTSVVDWAKTVVQNHPHHNVILLTHSHLTDRSTIEPTKGGYGDNSPQYVFDQLLKPYSNIRLVFCGHTGNHGYRTDPGANGNTIYQFLQCFHDRATNPTRLLEIDTVKGTLKSQVYCPATDQHKDDASFTVADIQWVPAK